jgi:hypothetical protein
MVRALESALFSFLVAFYWIYQKTNNPLYTYL